MWACCSIAQHRSVGQVIAEHTRVWFDLQNTYGVGKFRTDSSKLSSDHMQATVHMGGH